MWHVVVPVKGGGRAKSRLDLDPGSRRLLAAAMASDTIAAVHACPVVATVTVLCGRGAATGLELPPGVATLTEPLVMQPSVTGLGGLNAQLAWAARHGAGATQPVAIVVADLPSLTPRSLAVALTRAEEIPLGIVVDRHGTGTTVLSTREPALIEPAFGSRSAAAHQAQGAVVIDAPPDVRCDVDTLVDLGHALALGVGTRTGAHVAGSGVSAHPAAHD